MKNAKPGGCPSQLVEEELELSLVDLCHACQSSAEYVTAWVHEGILQPRGETLQGWRFSGQSLRRARLARWLSCDLEVNPPGVALALDLLDDIAELRAQLLRQGRSPLR